MIYDFSGLFVAVALVVLQNTIAEIFNKKLKPDL
jgi:hypothetical protein